MVTGEYIDVEAGPNWDDDFGGSPVYAENDVNLEGLPEEVRQQMFEIQRLAFFYMPRICNHCLNPACVASCPSGALYKRGEDGIVLLNQKACRAWRSCVSACPYKKTYFNWSTGKSEKCILCYPRVETGQAPACFHSCVGRIRYLGNLLYDADRVEETAKQDDLELVDAQRDMILDPHDPEVIAQAKANGIADSVIKTAQESPVYKFVKEWGLGLPLHTEFRTLPMLFYVPPLSPVLSTTQGGTVRNDSDDLFADIEKARVPIQFMGKLFAGGNDGKVRYALKKQYAVRMLRRHLTVGDIDLETAERALQEAECSQAEADAIYKLTSLATFDDRFVIPPAQREMAIEMLNDPLEHKKSTGFGFREAPQRS
jgi:nitrate reductase beta subunit